MADLTIREILPSNLVRCATTILYSPNAAEVSRREIDIAVGTPRTTALKRCIGEILHRRATHRDLAKFSSSEETDPLSIRREKWTLTSFCAVERFRRNLT